MKKLLIFVIIFAILCGCSKTETPEENSPSVEESSFAEESSSEQPEKETVWTTLRDFSGEKIDYENDVSRFSLNYVLAWNLTSDEYIRIEDPYINGKEQNIAGFTVGREIYTTYAIPYTVNDFAACVEARYMLYTFGETVALSGVFAALENENGKYFGFFPYYEEGKNLYFVHKRSEYAEKSLEALESSLFELTEKEVQPAEVICGYTDENDQFKNILSYENLSEYTGTAFDGTVGYVEATVYLSSLRFDGKSYPNGDTDIYKTLIYGNVEKIEITGIH